MGWKLVGKPKSVEVTKKIAEQFATMDPAPSDRPLSPRRLEVYKKIMEAGQFRPVTWASAFCKETGGTYRVNGKHTSTLLAAQVKMPTFYAVIEQYSCDTLEDVARLYSTFDSKMQSRTTKDINVSFAATVPELAEVEISDKNINISVSGMSYAKWMEDYFSIQPAERAELLIEHPKFVLWIHHILGNKFKPREGEVRQTGKHMQRLPVTAAMFLTHQKDASDAETFWTAVRDETGSGPEVPDRRLSKFLLLSISGGGGRSRGSTTKKIVSNREVFVKCLQAWNAWRQDRETVELRYYTDNAVPEVG
jgi:hypothetical protein